VVAAAAGVLARAAGAALRAHAAPGGRIPPIGRQAAQRLARAELARPEYHPHESLTVRILRAALHVLSRLLQAASRAPGGWWGLIALAVLAVLVVSVVLARIGPVARSARRREGLVAGGRALTARDHREAAGRLADAGDYGAAICECVRAIAAELDERGVLPPRAGRTADEFAAEAARAMPALADGLHGAAVAFDEVRYGQRAGTRPGYERLRDLDLRVKASAPRVEPAAAAVGAAARGAP
jgi:uncharacterized protein DUF4129